MWYPRTASGRANSLDFGPPALQKSQRQFGAPGGLPVPLCVKVLFLRVSRLCKVRFLVYACFAYLAIYSPIRLDGRNRRVKIPRIVGR